MRPVWRSGAMPGSKKEKYRMEYIDMHSHILPGLDDGSKNMEMTLAMLRVAVEEGIGTIYTTPHCMPGKGHPTLAKVEERIRLVQEAAEAEGIQITLKKGTEYYYIEEMSEWMEEGKIITLGDSHCVLVEFEQCSQRDPGIRLSAGDRPCGEIPESDGAEIRRHPVDEGDRGTDPGELCFRDRR